MKRAIALATAFVVPALLALLAAPTAFADVPAGIQSYGSAAHADGAHVIFYTQTFPNFGTGAADNYYPLTLVNQDSSPSSSALATYADAGPGANTVIACGSGGGPTCQLPTGVPYARATYPGTGSSRVDTCSPSPAGSGCPNGTPASYADSKAAELSADADGYYQGGGTQPFSGAFAESHTIVNSDGSLAVKTHSGISSATFGGGAIQISKVDVVTTVSVSGGTPTVDATVTVGQVLVNGQPATIDQNGVTVNQTNLVPCPSSAPVPAAPPLPAGGPSVGGTAGCVPSVEHDTIKVYAVSPQKTASGSEGKVIASGLHVIVTQPPAPGAPNQSVEYIFGEGFSDGNLTGGAPTGASAGTDLGLGGSDFGSSDLGSGDLGGALGDQSSGQAANATGQRAAVAAVLRNNRQPLALLFLFWEALVVATTAAWVYSRRRSLLADLESVEE